jgi:hypothetical protein
MRTAVKVMAITSWHTLVAAALQFRKIPVAVV